MTVLLSQHAQTRMQQRAISNDMLDNLLSFGEIRFNGHGTKLITFPKKMIKSLKSEMGHHAFVKLERHLNLYAVLSQDGELITTGYRSKRIKKH